MSYSYDNRDLLSALVSPSGTEYDFTYGWIFIYLACTISVLLELRHVRAADYALNRDIFPRALALLVPIALLIVMPFFTKDHTEDFTLVEEKTRMILTAVVENDIPGWKDARHPQSLSYLDQLNWRELGLFREELVANDSLPEGEVGELKQVWIKSEDHIDTFIINAQYIVPIGNRTYRVTVQYLSDYMGKGIENITISPVG